MTTQEENGDGERRLPAPLETDTLRSRQPRGITPRALSLMFSPRPGSMRKMSTTGDSVSAFFGKANKKVSFDLDVDFIDEEEDEKADVKKPSSLLPVLKKIFRTEVSLY